MTTNEMQLLCVAVNNFRAKHLAEYFRASEFYEILPNIGTAKRQALLQALILKGYVHKKGESRARVYKWLPIYKNEARLEEYKAISPISFEKVLHKMDTILSETRKKYKKAKKQEPKVEEPLTLEKCLKFLMSQGKIDVQIIINGIPL